MPLTNRVTPLGDLIACPHRGTMMGNRGGRIHDPATRNLMRRQWASRRWICCRLAFKNRTRRVWGDGYTELFFADEASALAAGHRPCYECRRHDAMTFAKAVQRAFGLDHPPKADWLDARLHAERLLTMEDRPRVDADTPLSDGCVIARGNQAFLLQSGSAYPWVEFSWRDQPIRRTDLRDCRLVTPPLIVGALDAGYRPQIVISDR